jgi:hypothetical protein
VEPRRMTTRRRRRDGRRRVPGYARCDADGADTTSLDA